MPSAHSASRSIRAATAAMVSATSACVLAHPSPRRAGPPPASLGARTVAFPSGSGSTIRAWLMPGAVGAGAVLLLHGVHSTRQSMLGRARFLHDAGFTVLAPDFQAHGESPGRYVTFGALESLDASAALAALRRYAPGERVGVIGVSMGGAASLVGRQPLATDALVLESVYPTFHDAVADRMRAWLGPLAFLEGAVTPALIGLVGPQVGVDADRLRPIDAIAHVTQPVLIIAGTADRYTPIAESRALYSRARAPKEIWEVVGAKHQDLHAFATDEYERRVGRFLASHLRHPGGLHSSLIAPASEPGESPASATLPAGRP